MATVLSSTRETIDRFIEAFNRHDLDAVMAAMTDDCIFESLFPPPDGLRFEGQDAVRQMWRRLFTGSPDLTFEAEEIFDADDCCTARWVMRYTAEDGEKRHLRGVDIFRVRDGKVTEKRTYVKSPPPPGRERSWPSRLS